MAGHLQQELDDLNGLDQRTEAVRAERNERLVALCTRIKDGATTGDRITDWALVHFGSADEERLKFYRELEASLAAHVGQFILVLTTERGDLLIHRGCFGGEGPRDSDYGTDRHYYLAVISGGLVFDLQKGGCGFHTERYVKLSSLHHSPDTTITGNLMLESKYGFPILPHKVSGSLDLRIFEFDRPTEPQMNIVLGDEEVERLFAFSLRGHRDRCLCPASRLLGRPMEESEEYKKEVAEAKVKALAELQDLVTTLLQSGSKKLAAAFKEAHGRGVAEEELQPYRELFTRFGLKIS